MILIHEQASYNIKKLRDERVKDKSMSKSKTYKQKVEETKKIKLSNRQLKR